MKIGIYNPRVGTAESGGTETFLREMMKRLVNNHSITLLTGEGSLHPTVKSLDIEVIKVPFTRKESRINSIVTSNTPILPAEIESLSLFLNAKLSGQIQRLDRESDAISTHYYLDNILVSRSVETPNLFRFPGIKQPSVRWKTMAHLADPDLYISNSQSTRKRVERWLDLTIDGTVYAGVDLEQFSPSAQPAFEDDHVAILFVGRLDKGKGLRDLITAAGSLPDARIHIVGSGTLETELKERSLSEGVSDRINFHGSVPHSEIHRYYAAADIFCLPSYHEGFPVVNMEAMASGCPIVTTTIDSILEQMEDGEQGLLFEPGNVQGLVRALRQLIADPQLRANMGSNALKRAQSFTWDSQAANLESFYTSL